MVVSVINHHASRERRIKLSAVVTPPQFHDGRSRKITRIFCTRTAVGIPGRVRTLLVCEWYQVGIHNHTYISPSKRCSNPGYNLVRMRTQSGSQTSSLFECIHYFGHLTAARSGPSSGKKKKKKKKMASTVRPGRLVMLNSGSRVRTRRRKSGFHAISRDCVLIR